MKGLPSILLIVALAGCGVSPTGSLSPSTASAPIDSFSPSASPTPIATPGPSISPGAAAEWFGDVAGWTLLDSLELAQQFEKLANDAVSGRGFARVQAAADGTRNQNGYPASVVAFTLFPAAGHSEVELLDAVVEAIRSGVGITPVSVCSGQARSLLFGEREVVIGSWAGRADAVFLVTDGSSTGAARELYSLLIQSGIGGCT